MNFLSGISMPDSIWLDEKLERSEKFVLAALVKLAEEDNTFTKDDLVSLTELMQCSPVWIEKVISQLKEKGYIKNASPVKEVMELTLKKNIRPRRVGG